VRWKKRDYWLTMAEPSIVVRIADLQKSYKSHKVLNGVDLSIREGQLVCLIGRSGCGKSTLLRCLNGLETFDRGSVTIGEDTVIRESFTREESRLNRVSAQKIRREVGMVFQDFRLFPHWTVLDNVARSLSIVKGTSSKEAYERAESYLGKVGLLAHKDKFPIQLSGGQQQRGAIARALALQPKVILYDEPTSALDPELVSEVLHVMKTLDQEGLTQIVVTHEMSFARDASDIVVYLEEGQVVEVGSPDEIFRSPKDDRTRLFLKSVLNERSHS